METTSRRVLVVGGGPAGAVTAFWLAKAGFQVVVAERSTGKFAYGQGIDVTGPAVDVVRKMGLYDTIRSKATGEGGFALLDDNSNFIARLGTAEDENGKGLTLTQEIEIMRGDITKIFADAADASDLVRYRFGCRVTEISQRDTHVSVVLSDTGKSEDFTAIIGADGMMSSVRRMAFDRESTKDSFREIEQYTAFFSVTGQPEDKPDSRLQHAPGRRAILIRPVSATSSERASCYLVHTKKWPDMDDALSSYGPSEKQKELFAEMFKTMEGPLAKRSLQGMWDSSDFYVAQTAQIKLPTWHTGRVALVGDAAYAPSPITGQGTALAILGSFVLAGEMASTPNDPVAAFARYETCLREYVTKAQKIPGGSIVPKLVNPETAFGIRILRVIFWLLAWTKVYKLLNSKGDNDKFKLPDYKFDGTVNAN